MGSACYMRVFSFDSMKTNELRILKASTMPQVGLEPPIVRDNHVDID